MSTRRKKRSEWYWWAGLAMLVGLTVLSGSVITALVITAAVLVMWRIPAHRSDGKWRIGHRKSPVYIPAARRGSPELPSGKRGNVHEYAEK